MGRPIDVHDDSERLDEYLRANVLFPSQNSDEQGIGSPLNVLRDESRNPERMQDDRQPRSPFAPLANDAVSSVVRWTVVVLWGLAWLLMLPAAVVIGLTIVFYRPAATMFQTAFQDVADTLSELK